MNLSKAMKTVGATLEDTFCQENIFKATLTPG